jgi:predicted nucleic acid-binding protein
VTYLLDVNSLVAWHHAGSPHHARFHAWAAEVGRTNLRTCALSELGFLRVSMQVFGYTLRQATAELSLMRKETGGFVELAPSPKLPSWAATAARTSDGYLVQLAAAFGMKLATLDAGIKDLAAELIP